MSSLEKRKEGMGPGEYEQKAVEAGFVRVCCCDEAGAGPLAGPVYAAAVILAQGADIPGLNDSKKLTEKKREALFPLIQQSALAWSVARVEAEEIDRTDILSARIRAMQLAIEGLSLRPDFALIDGNRDHGRSAAITVPHWCVVKGDSISPSIAAASILAKVSRDRFMLEMAERYPQYGFERHKGYGTRLHYEMLRRYGEYVRRIPAAKSVHHSFVGGLLMHTANMVKSACFYADLYPDTLDRSLLIAGTLLHDFCKCEEFVTSPLGLVTDYSVKGQLLGHLVMGAEAVDQIAGLLQIPEEKSVLLQHMILSHHGEPEFGAAVRPMCAESELLSYLDMIDSRMEIYAETMAQTPAGEFSGRVFALEKRIYHHN